MEKFFLAYLECALWSETDENGDPLDECHDTASFATETLDKMREDCKKFFDATHALILGKEERAGHDFWLTRNRHGAGFWDGDWPERDGSALTNCAHMFGECHLYVGDDEFIYLDTL